MADTSPFDRKAHLTDFGTMPTIGSDKIAAILELMPEVNAEGKIDFDKLHANLGSAVSGPDRYFFTWTGKREAVRLLQTLGAGALAPDSTLGVDPDTSENVLIEGDNLEALKLMYSAYFDRVKVIYIDPPYNTGNDFVYEDDYSDHLTDYLRKSGQIDASGNLLVPKPEKAGRLHSAWLSMLYPRLLLARQLLSDDGAIFVSIDENEVHNLRMLLNEVFGEENFIAQITVLVNPKGRVLDEHFARSHEYLLVYAKLSDEADFSIEKSDAEVEKQYPHKDADDVRYRLLELRNTHHQFGRHNRPNMYYPIYVDPKGKAELDTVTVQLEEKKGLIPVYPDWDDGFEGCWTWYRPTAEKLLSRLRARNVAGRWKIFRKARAVDDKGVKVRKKLQTIWSDPAFYTEKGQAAFDALMPKGLFQAPKPVELVKAAIALCDDPEAIVLDFFGGSGTTGQAVYEMNQADGGKRRFVIVQLPEKTNDKKFPTISAICAARIKRAGEAIKKAAKKSTKTKNGADDVSDFGFRYFRLTESNFKTWERTPPKDGADYEKRLTLFATTLRDKVKPEDVVWQIALREGLLLSSEISEGKAGKNRIHEIGDDATGQDVVICLDSKLDDAIADKLDLERETVFICRDSAANDSSLANLSLRCNLKTL